MMAYSGSGDCSPCPVLWWCYLGVAFPWPVGPPPPRWDFGPRYTREDVLKVCGNQSGSGGSGVLTTGVLLSGCATVYPGILWGVWSVPGGAGDCDCFTGSFPLFWDGTAWEGSFGGCASPVTVQVTPAAFAGGSSAWAVAFSSGGFAFPASPYSLPVSCGLLPTPSVITVTGCPAFPTFMLSE